MALSYVYGPANNTIQLALVGCGGNWSSGPTSCISLPISTCMRKLVQEVPWHLYPGVWREVFSVISLDGARHFFADMGLSLSDAHTLQLAVRAAIRNHQGVYSRICPLTEESVVSMAFEGLNGAAQSVADDDTVRLRYWLAHVYSAAPSLQPSTPYVMAMSEWVRTYQWKKIDPIGFEQPDEILNQWRNSRPFSAIERRIREAKQAPLSDWDRWLYDLAKYRHDAQLDSGFQDPFEAVEATIRIERFRQFWVWLVNHARKEHIKGVFASVEESRQELNRLFAATLPPTCEPFALFPPRGG